MNISEFYNSINEDCTEVLKRFGGSEAMLEKFLKKFLADGSFAALQEAIKSGNKEAVFTSAHTLKGVTSNFGFLKVHNLAAKIVEEYRAGNFGAIEPLFLQLKPEYSDLIEKLRSSCEL